MPIKVINSDLKSLLGEELFKQVDASLKDKDVVIELQENYIPKSRFDEVNTQAKDQKARADKFETDLAAATKAAKSQEELNTKIAELTAANEKVKTEYEVKIAQQAKDHLLHDGLRVAKAKNPKAVMALLDLEKVVVKDGKLDGLDSQLEPLKKSDGWLFEAETQQKLDQFGNPIGQPGSGGDLEAEKIAGKYVGEEAIKALSK